MSFLFCRIKVSAKKLSLKKLWQVHLQQEAITTKKQARCISDKIQLVINTAAIKPSAVVSSGVVLQQSGGVDSKCQVSIAQSQATQPKNQARCSEPEAIPAVSRASSNQHGQVDEEQQGHGAMQRQSSLMDHGQDQQQHHAMTIKKRLGVKMIRAIWIPIQQ